MWLSRNPHAIRLLEKNQNKIHWESLSGNPGAIHLLEQNPDKINWELLSGNPRAIHLLEQNPTKINWELLSGNPGAIHLLEQNPDKINWNNLSENPNAIPLLKKHYPINNIKRLYKLGSNPGIFTTNYEFLTKRMVDTGIAEDIIMNRFNPKNMDKFVDWGYDEFENIG